MTPVTAASRDEQPETPAERAIARLQKLELAVAALTTRVMALESELANLSLQPDPDGWVSNGYEGDTETHALVKEQFGECVVGEPKPTHSRSVDELKADGVVGLYVVRQ